MMPPTMSFVVPGAPVPKARARVSVRKVRGVTKVRAHTPKTTAEYGKRVGLYARAARPRNWPLLCEYKVSFVAYPAADRGDVDNYLKSLLDGAQGVLWANDKSVRRLGECEVKPHMPDPHMQVSVEAIPVTCAMKRCQRETLYPDDDGRCEECQSKAAKRTR